MVKTNSMSNVYTDKELNNEAFMRTFSKDVLTEELVWHRDYFDRRIEIVEGQGWGIQIENGIPKELKQGDTVWIPALTYHRIIKGETDLVLMIKEFK